MKKLLSFLIIGIFIFSTLGAVGQTEFQTTSITNYEEKTQSLDYTHTVLVEVGTATWCPSCPASNTAWHTIYNTGNYQFEYTELVYDKNTMANTRFMQFNPRYVPTSYWDGGEYTYPGTSQITFQNYLDASGARPVPDITATLQITWVTGGQLAIDYSIDNNEPSSYGGTLRIYIHELESTLWNDYNGNPYYHAFLDFAVNQPITIPSGDTMSDSVIWDAVAAGYPGVTPENLQVILAVFGDEPFTGYSDPPSGNPFTGYLCEETIAATPEGGGTLIPDLEATGDLSWSQIPSGSTQMAEIQVSNVGDDGSKLNWEVESCPPWGDWTFTPNSGIDLTPSGSPMTISVKVVAPEKQESEFFGTVKIVNLDDPSDYIEITISLSTPMNYQSPLLNLIRRIIGLFPLLQQIILL